MPSNRPSGWSSVIDVGGLPISVVATGCTPPGWPAGAPARITGCVEASREGPPAAGRTVLAPAEGYERAYLTMAAALAADDMVGLLGAGGSEYRLRSLGEALVAEWGRASSAEEARGFTEAELAGALMMLRSLPRRLPARAAPSAGEAVAGDLAAVVDLMQVRRARGR